jgi:hypothetical protein
MFRYQALLNEIDQFCKLARREEDLVTLQANIGNYIHFSNSDRFGISYHKDIHPGNPRAIYGFPLTSSGFKALVEKNFDFPMFQDYGSLRYIYIFNVSGQILDMDNIDLKEMSSKVRDFAKHKFLGKGNYHLSYDPTSEPYRNSGTSFMQWLHRIVEDYKHNGILSNEHSAMNILLRGTGYDAIKTNNYGFGDDIKTEVAVVNPSTASLIAKVNNPMLTKEDIQKQEQWDFNHSLYKKEKEILEKQQEEKYNNYKHLLQKWKAEEEKARALSNKLWAERKYQEANEVMQKFEEQNKRPELDSHSNDVMKHFYAKWKPILGF